jgi:hypothetical protein
MSCFITNVNAKEELVESLDNLNFFLRNNNLYIDFSTGTLWHELHGFCGPLEDDGENLILLEDSSGEVLHETKDKK